MERLTYVAENGEVLFHPADLLDDEGITITQLAKDGRYKALEEIAERLANREQAEEQGLLLRLPCKVGDSVYRFWYVDEKPYKVQTQVIRTLANLVAIMESGEFGKSVFLSLEEAEAKLKEMKENQ